MIKIFQYLLRYSFTINLSHYIALQLSTISDQPICRTVGEWNGLASLLLRLFQSLVSKLPAFEDLRGLDGLVSFVQREREYGFALHICQKYSCTTWLRALATMFKHMGLDNFCMESLKKLLLATKFCLDKLQGPEFAFTLASQENSDDIQVRNL